MLASDQVATEQLVAPGLALLFDMDGVIIHSTPLHDKAWEIYLERHGLNPDQVRQRMHGKRNDEIVRDFFGEGLDHDVVTEHGAAKERLFRELMAPPEMERWMVPGVREFLQAHHGWPAALASNAERPNIDFVLDESGIRRHFQFIVDGHQAKLPKPAPDIYLKAAQLLGVRRENCIVFEDSLPGVTAGHAAGMRVVGLTTTLPQLPHVQVAVPDFEDPRLASWLRTQRAVE